MSELTFPLPHILEPGEVVANHVATDDFVLAVTARRIVVVEDDRTVLDLPFSGLRRVQLDLERGRDATLVLVPESIRNEPRVFGVPIESLMDTVLALVRITEQMNKSTDTQTG